MPYLKILKNSNFIYKDLFSWPRDGHLVFPCGIMTFLDLVLIRQSQFAKSINRSILWNCCLSMCGPWGILMQPHWTELKLFKGPSCWDTCNWTKRSIIQVALYGSCNLCNLHNSLENQIVTDFLASAFWSPQATLTSLWEKYKNTPVVFALHFRKILIGIQILWLYPRSWVQTKSEEKNNWVTNIYNNVVLI